MRDAVWKRSQFRANGSMNQMAAYMTQHRGCKTETHRMVGYQSRCEAREKCQYPREDVTCGSKAEEQKQQSKMQRLDLLGPGRLSFLRKELHG